MVENGGSTVFFTRFAISDNILYMMYICFIFQTIPNELPVVRREYKNGMYSTFPYFVSKVISELPYVFGLPFLTMAVCYFMIGGFFQSPGLSHQGSLLYLMIGVFFNLLANHPHADNLN